MKKKKLAKRLLGKQVWCSVCIKEIPVHIKPADFLVPIRTDYYGMLEDDSGIDNRLVGICKKHLKDLNGFQKKNTQRVDVKNKNLISSSNI